MLTQQIQKLNLLLCLIKLYALKKYGGMEVFLCTFLASAEYGGEWST